MKQLIRIISFLKFPLAVFIADVVVSKILGLYLIFPHLDIPFHYMGGLSIAYSSAKILVYMDKEGITSTLANKALFLLILFSLTATAAVFWEFAEFMADQSLNTNLQVSLANTMQDQFMGIVGGTTWVYICARNFKKISQEHKHLEIANNTHK